MKLSWGFIASSLSCAAAAQDVTGSIYVWDSTPKDPALHSHALKGKGIDASTARLILAQRLGVSNFHAIPSSPNLDVLNQFGGRRVMLFGGEREQNDAHALVWIEGVDPSTALETREWSNYWTTPLSSPPPASANDRLLDDLVAQVEALPIKRDPKQKMYNTHIRNADILRRVQEPTVHNDYLTMIRVSIDNNVAHQHQKLQDTITKLSKLAHEEGSYLTVVVMPPAGKSSNRSPNPYGSYELPARLGKRMETSEAILTPSPEPSTVGENQSIPDLESFPHITEKQPDMPPVLGILPSCFQSLKECQRTTSNCTGHGECVLVHKAKADQQKNCYSCSCKAAVVEVKGGGKKTTYWGGPACQKKDVSIPFWLFVGTTLTLMFLVGSGIGMLYSMGAEELPSVIGAGVSGPVKK